MGDVTQFPTSNSQLPTVKVRQWDSEADGELSERAFRRRLEAQGYSVSLYVYSPGTHFPEHTHSVDKIDAVLAGRFELVVSGTPVVLGPGDSIAVPRGVPHTATVLGDEPVVSLDAVKNR
jgi:quercetin dioxygenase-like cupin family protein